MSRIMKLSTRSTSTLLLFLLHLLCFAQISGSSDSISMGQVIRDGDTIVSSKKAFELGFFNPGSSNNRYVGIWYKSITARTVIWVANRESPLKNTGAGVLMVDWSGNLVILDESSNTTVWSTNASIAAKNPVAQLLDSGNLIIREQSTQDYYLWRSFDYLTDTFMPGMTLGCNLVTGKQIYLSSWKTSEDPAPGDFTYSLDVIGYVQMVIRQGDALKHRIGPFNGLRYSGFPNQNHNALAAATDSLIVNSSMVYYIWNAVDTALPARFTLSPTGVGQVFVWMNQSNDWVVFYRFPQDLCDAYGKCGVYEGCDNAKMPMCWCLDRFVPRDQKRWASSDWSGGCVRKSPLNCWNDVFLKYTGIKMPDAQFTRHNASLNLMECEEMCLGNCSCTAYTNLNISNGGSGCLMWFGDLVDIKVLPGEDQEIYIRMAASELGYSIMEQTIHVFLLTSFGGLLVFGLTTLLIRKSKKYPKLNNKDLLEGGNDEDNELCIYNLLTVSKATNSFSADNKLGEGGFGPVYKGILEDGKEIAVKCLSQTSSQGLEEFKNEVLCIAKLQHRNLVKLFGWCIDGKEKMLIYEYMPNKSLDLLLFRDAETKHLNWPKRCNIINGIAKGLLYLHQDSRLRVIHRDLKASNVLLDNDLNPKISDFGMARIFQGNETEGNTRHVVGTYGYMSPEYAVEGFFSLKSDVYSFGVLVLEIVSGQTNRGFHHSDHHHNLVGHAWILYKEGRSFELVDPSIADTLDRLELLRSIHVALLCVQQRPKDRPSMSSVVVMLVSGGVLPEAKKPGFFTERHGFVPSRSNEYTITEVRGR